jgi:RimJ/RimL family protein N-acetyltransferase
VAAHQVLVIHLLPEPLPVRGPDGTAPIPPWAIAAPLFAVVRTDDELSVVCAAARVPDGVTTSAGWRALKLRGPFALDVVGVLLAVAGPLAAAGVSVLPIGTHDTDYLLVPAGRLDDAVAALERAGHRVRQRTAGERPTLRTPRLVLRPFQAADAPDVERLAGAHEVASTTLHIPHPYPAGAAERWIAEHAAAWEAGGRVAFAVCRADDGALVGSIGLTVAPAHARAELGYWIGVPHWNRGYATEAARAVLAFAFDVLGLHRVQAHFKTRNPASGRVMEKLGMRREGLRRGAFRKDGVFEDVEEFAVLASDRPAPGAGADATG